MENETGVAKIEKAHLVFVNDREHVVRSSYVTFEEIVALVRERKTHRSSTEAFHVRYSRSSREVPSGSLEPGASLKLLGGMRFEVVRIDEDARKT